MFLLFALSYTIRQQASLAAVLEAFLRLALIHCNFNRIIRRVYIHRRWFTE